MSYLSLDFLLYLSRWVVSAFAVMPVLYILVKYNCCKGKYEEYIHLILVQVFGAFIFFYIDQWIFS